MSLTFTTVYGVFYMNADGSLNFQPRDEGFEVELCQLDEREEVIRYLQALPVVEDLLMNAEYALHQLHTQYPHVSISWDKRFEQIAGALAFMRQYHLPLEAELEPDADGPCQYCAGVIVPCERCQGAGKISTLDLVCQACGGRGVQAPEPEPEICSHCAGTGNPPSGDGPICVWCGGNGVR